MARHLRPRPPPATPRCGRRGHSAAAGGGGGANAERHNFGQQLRSHYAAVSRKRVSRRRGNGPSRPPRASAAGRASGERPTIERPEKGRRGSGVNIARPCTCAARYAGPTEPSLRQTFENRIVAGEWPLPNFDERSALSRPSSGRGVPALVPSTSQALLASSVPRAPASRASTSSNWSIPL